MYKKEPLEKLEIVKISRYEKEILCRLKDLMFEASPMYMTEDGSAIQCDCGSEDDPIGHLWESYYQVKGAMRFILQQILISHNLSPLNPLLEEFEKDSISNILFAETPNGEFYMSLGTE